MGALDTVIGLVFAIAMFCLVAFGGIFLLAKCLARKKP